MHFNLLHYKLYYALYFMLFRIILKAIVDPPVNLSSKVTEFARSLKANDHNIQDMVEDFKNKYLESGWNFLTS